MQPLISIIIPTFNRASLIGETLDSVLGQTYTNWECIIVDDGSDDNTAVVVASYIETDKRFRFFQRPENRIKGANACRNLGFEKSEGEYIKWFDSDDILLPEALEKQISILQDSEKEIAISEYHLFKENQTGNNEAQYNYEGINDLFLDYISGNLVLNTQIILFKRSAIEQFTFDDSLSRAQDLDFIYRVLQKKQNQVGLQNEVLVLIRAHANSITGTFHKGNLHSIDSEIRVRQFIFNENYRNGNIPETARQRVLVMYLNSFRALLINGYYKEYRASMKALRKKLSLKKRVVMTVLLALAALYNKTGKGIYVYGRIAKNI